MSGNLNPSDYVGMSFWIISAAMVAAFFFFWVERDRVEGKWKTSLTVAALVCGIAAIHYFYMRGVWVATQETPIVFRYVDWLLTVPLQIVEFYLILSAIAVVAGALFWRLMVASVLMLVFGYMGETGAMNMFFGWFLGMLGWLYILYEIHKGEAAEINAAEGTEASQFAFDAIKWIVTVGWAIYPIGYLFMMTGGAGGSDGVNELNLVYNLADFVNKIAFGVVIWYAAVTDSAASEEEAA